MAYSYDRRYERRNVRFGSGPSNRTTLGYWVPLVLTVTAATVGVAAWIWSERSDSEGQEDHPDYGSSSDAEYARRLELERRDIGEGPPPSYQTDLKEGEERYGRVVLDEEGREVVQGDESFYNRMNNMIRRTPSPQQLYDGASRRVVAGVAAMGRGLRSIQEESKDDYVDHERWSEEAETREREDNVAVGGAAAAALGAGGLMASRSKEDKPVGLTKGNKRTVAVVVSAESAPGFAQDAEDDSYHIEHASILSHLVSYVDTDKVELLILIYAPHLSSHPATKTRPSASSRASSYSNISAAAAEADDDNEQGPNPLYSALTTQAKSLVTQSTHVLPFTTPTGHVHLLRHLAPSIVYMQESLCGSEAGGEMVQQIDGWVGQTVVVVGAEGAGLVDTETEDEAPGKNRRANLKWWQDHRRVGLGKGVEVVESVRVGEDWSKRVHGAS